MKKELIQSFKDLQKVFRKALQDCQIEKGDIIKIIKDTCSHNIPIGTIVKISEVTSEFSFTVKYARNYRYVNRHNLILVQKYYEVESI